MNLSNIKIAIIGLGYVGLPLAVEFGKQRPVLGFDINVARIAELQSGQDGTLEVTSDDLRNAKQLGYSSNLADLADCGIFIVTVPITPRSFWLAVVSTTTWPVMWRAMSSNAC